MTKSILTMKRLKGNYGICRLEKDQSIPDWSMKGGFFSITRTENELSLVCSEEVIPERVTCEKGWQMLKVEGPLDFALVGILSKISTLLANEGISIFAISTYDTDYILIKEQDMPKGIETLIEGGYSVIDV